MSGHSKWKTIKRKKGATDAKRGAVFTRLGREIAIATRQGGSDIDSNFRLRLAVEKARAENMPKDNIERAIKKAAGEDKDAAVFEEITFEGYGPHGAALIVECVSDTATAPCQMYAMGFQNTAATWQSLARWLGSSSANVIFHFHPAK